MISTADNRSNDGSRLLSSMPAGFGRAPRESGGFRERLKKAGPYPHPRPGGEVVPHAQSRGTPPVLSRLDPLQPVRWPSSSYPGGMSELPARRPHFQPGNRTLPPSALPVTRAHASLIWPAIGAITSWIPCCPRIVAMHLSFPLRGIGET